MTGNGYVAPVTARPWNAGSSELGDVKALYDDALRDHDALAAVFDTGGFALDMLGDIGDPLGAVISCAVGWIVEHVSFLRDPVDWLAGDPQSIEASIATWTNVGTGMRDAAAGYAADLAGLGPAAWSGDAADAYRARAAEWIDTLNSAATLADVESAVIAATGGLCAAFRGEIFAAISAAVERWVMVGLVALANSAWTFGASLAAWVIDVEIDAGLLYARIMARIAELVAKAGRVAQTLGRDGGALAEIGDRLEHLAQAMTKNVRSSRGMLGWDRRLSRTPAADGRAVTRQAEHLAGSLGRLDARFGRGTVDAAVRLTKDVAEVATDPSAEHVDELAGGVTQAGVSAGTRAATKSVKKAATGDG